MNRPEKQVCCSYFCHSSAVAPLAFLGGVALICLSLLSMGCDAGTYNRRLKESPKVPAVENPTVDADSDADDQPAEAQ